MNQEQFSQSWDQHKGHLKKQWGKLTDEHVSQIQGDQKKFDVAIEKRYGEMNGEVRKWADRWYAKWSGLYVGYQEEKLTSACSEAPSTTVAMK